MTSVKHQLKGVVVSKPSDTTAVVMCTRFIQHPKYRKFFKRSKKYHAQDFGNACREGDAVVLEAMRPRSRTKRWRVMVNSQS